MRATSYVGMNVCLYAVYVDEKNECPITSSVEWCIRPTLASHLDLVQFVLHGA